MEKQTVVRTMRSYVGGSEFITKQQFCGYMGVSRSTADRKLKGIEKVNGKYYFIRDVADRIIGKI